MILPIIFALPRNGKKLTEAELDSVLKIYDTKAKEFCNQNVHAGWDVATDTDSNEKKTLQVKNQIVVKVENYLN